MKRKAIDKSAQDNAYATELYNFGYEKSWSSTVKLIDNIRVA